MDFNRYGTFTVKKKTKTKKKHPWFGALPTSECPFTGPFKKLCKMASGSEKIANLHLRGAYFELGL